jgi:hypothetical protein
MAQQIAKVVQSAAPTVTVVTGTAGVVSTGADIISIVAKHPDFQQHLQRILGAKTPAELQDALSALSQYGAVAEAFGLVYARTHKPTIANNMAGGRNVPDIGVQHPSNQNMMQMDNGGTKGVNLPNSPDVPQGIQNQAHPTQPGTAITQPSQPGQPYNNKPNQVNPNTQPNAPGSTQNTPLQNIKGTIYSQTRLGKPFHQGTVKEFDSKGAHIRKLHIDTDDVYIQGRANPPPGNTPPPYASRFYGGTAAERALYGEDFAEKLIQQALRDSEEMIIRNMMKGRREIEIEYFPNIGSIGRGVRQNTTELIEMDTLRIIIVQDKNSGQYFLTTAYPVIKED